MQAPRGIRFVSLTFLAGFGFGVFAGVALALLAVLMVEDADSGTIPPAAALATPTQLPSDITPTPDTRPRTRTTVEVRLGPGNGFAIVGTLERGQVVDVVGRDVSAAWAAIRFPPNSSARGWVPISQLDGLGEDVESLAVVSPTPLPSTVVFPTVVVQAPAASQPLGRAPSANGIPIDGPAQQPPAPTATPGPPDLAVQELSVLPDGRVKVVVANLGPGDLQGQSVFVSLRDLSTMQETLISPQRSLLAGASLTLQSSLFRLEHDSEVIAVVDPFTAVRDANRANNTLRVRLSAPAVPTPTRVPGAID